MFRRRSWRELWVRWIGVGLITAGCCLGGGSLTHAQTTALEFELPILYTTDLYGQLRDFRCRRRGTKKEADHTEAPNDISNLLHQVNRIRREVNKRNGDPDRYLDPMPMLLNTGDNLGISLASRFLLEFEDLSGVEFVVQAFKRFAYDLIGIGNHEFSVPRKRLKAFIESAVGREDQRFSAANMVAAKGSLASHPIGKYINKFGPERVPAFVFERTVVRSVPSKRDAAGKVIAYKRKEMTIKIGVFHVAPAEMEKKVGAKAVDGLKFVDPAEKASEAVTYLREKRKVDVVIMMSHLEGSKSKGAKVKEVLSSASGIDLVITNELRDEGKVTFTGTFDSTGKGVYIVGGARYGKQLGRVRLRIRKTKNKEPGKVISARLDSIPLNDEKFDRRLRRDLIKWETSYCRRWGKPLGDGRIREGYTMTREKFASYMLNLFRDLTRAEVAVINRGAIRKKPFGDSGLVGYVTKDDLYRALPFNEKIELLKVKGSLLSSLGSSSDKFFFAGFDGSNINGRPIEEARVYTIATISFVANNRAGGFEKEGILSRKLFEYDNKSPTAAAYKKKFKSLAQPIRDMMVFHFAKNEYRQFKDLPPPPPPEMMEEEKKKKFKPKKLGKDELPFLGNLVNLADRPALKFSLRGEFNFRSVFVGPINIGTFYQQKDTLTGGFYEKYTGTGTLEANLQVDTRAHLWITNLSVGYGFDFSRQWNPGPPPQPNRDLIFQESDDRLTLKTEYRLRYFESLYPGKQRWYYTNPFVEAQYEMEMTRGSRPDLPAERVFEVLGTTEVFQRSEVRGKLGFSFQPFRDYLFNQKMSEKNPNWSPVDLTIKVSATIQQPLLLFYELKENTQPVANQNLNFGLAAEYRLASLPLFKIGNNPVTWDSSAVYLLTWIPGRTETRVRQKDDGSTETGNVQQDALFTHDLVLDNKISLQIIGGLRLSFGLRALFYWGFYRQDPTAFLGRREQGPLAVRFDPNLSLSFEWGARAQAY